MRELSGDDFGRAAPPVVWRAETGFCHDSETSAADVIRHEQEALGRALGIGATLLAALAEYPASALLWVTLTRDDALRYAPAEDVAQLRLDIPAVVIATDDDGGLLLFFPDDLTQPTGGAAMADNLKDDRFEAAFESYIRSGATLSDTEMQELDLEGVFDERGIMDRRYFERLDASGVLNDGRAAFYEQATASAAELVPSQMVTPQGRTLDHSYLVRSDQASPASSYVALDEEEQKRRAARSGGEMANPAHANLGANIRPDVGSGPGGLETYTTQKSADYRADPEQNISDYFRARFAEAERSANPPAMTLDLIHRDPWNAVQLPIPGDADKAFLHAARSAAAYLATLTPGADQYDPAPYHLADLRAEELAGRIDQIDARAPPLTLEAIANDPWNAVELPLPANADKELLTAARSAAEYCAEGHFGLREEALGDAPEGVLAEGGVYYGDREAFVTNDARWELANAREQLIDARLAQIEGRDSDPVQQQENDASTKRQDAERVARSGDTVSPDLEASVSDYFKGRQSEAKAEREGDGAELAAPDHGNDKTPGGGGGRGIF